MNFFINFFNNPYILALNSIMTIILAFFALRDRYLTFPHFKVEDLNLTFFKEGILSVEFEILNTSRVPLSLKNVILLCEEKEYQPIKLNYQNCIYGIGEIESIVIRKRDRSFTDQHIEELKPFILQYCEYKKLAFLFSTEDPDLLLRKPVLVLSTRSKKRKINLSGSPVDML